MTQQIRIRQSERDGHSLGLGVFAERAIVSGETILPVEGKQLSLAEVRTLEALESYPLQIGVRDFIDLEAPLRLVNHACEPNCYINEKALVALRDIQPGEELSFDYSLTIGQPGWCMRCRCGAVNCRKIVTCFMHLPSEVRQQAMARNRVPRYLLKVAFQEERFEGWQIIRHELKPRSEWWKKLVQLEIFRDHRLESAWDESVALELSDSQIDELEAAALEILEMANVGLDLLTEEGFPLEVNLPPVVLTSLMQSLAKRNPSVVTRIQFALDHQGRPRVNSIVGDAPVGVVEAGILQWDWLQSVFPDALQVNDIEERITEELKRYAGLSERLHLAYDRSDEGDRRTARYLTLLAEDAGLSVRRVYLEDIGWNAEQNCFVDRDYKEIVLPYFIYPWSFLIEEPFGEQLLNHPLGQAGLEPLWTSILREATFLPKLREVFPGHPYLREPVPNSLLATAYISSGKFVGLLLHERGADGAERVHPHFFHRR